MQPVYIRTPLLETASGRIVAAFADPEKQGRLSKFDLPKLTPFTRSTAEIIDELPETRAQGYALIDRERDIDVSGVALPIRDRSRCVVAAIGIPMIGPLRLEVVSAALPAAMDIANSISVELGFPARQSMPLA